MQHVCGVSRGAASAPGRGGRFRYKSAESGESRDARRGRGRVRVCHAALAEGQTRRKPRWTAK
eukprot:6713212-Prymnesium_polylepis.1